MADGNEQVTCNTDWVFLVGHERFPEPIARYRTCLNRPHPVLLDTTYLADMRVAKHVDKT